MFSEFKTLCGITEKNKNAAATSVEEYLSVANHRTGLYEGHCAEVLFFFVFGRRNSDKLLN